MYETHDEGRGRNPLATLNAMGRRAKKRFDEAIVAARLAQRREQRLRAAGRGNTPECRAARLDGIASELRAKASDNSITVIREELDKLREDDRF